MPRRRGADGGRDELGIRKLTISSAAYPFCAARVDRGVRHARRRGRLLPPRSTWRTCRVTL
ncbi:hypothetical protein QJS66_20355 [Kocuria rhizophila]|nr:hypothetical protein QJS66_20355 [Kocuria rhizophila]